MPKQTTVVEFEGKEIMSMLEEKAKQVLGKPTGGGVHIEFFGSLRAGDKPPEQISRIEQIQAKVTFSCKTDR